MKNAYLKESLEDNIKRVIIGKLVIQNGLYKQEKLSESISNENADKKFFDYLCSSLDMLNDTPILELEMNFIKENKLEKNYFSNFNEKYLFSKDSVLLEEEKAGSILNVDENKTKVLKTLFLNIKEQIKSTKELKTITEYYAKRAKDYDERIKLEKRIRECSARILELNDLETQLKEIDKGNTRIGYFLLKVCVRLIMIASAIMITALAIIAFLVIAQVIVGGTGYALTSITLLPGISITALGGIGAETVPGFFSMFNFGTTFLPYIDVLAGSLGIVMPGTLGILALFTASSALVAPTYATLFFVIPVLNIMHESDKYIIARIKSQKMSEKDLLDIGRKLKETNIAITNKSHKIREIINTKD
jgi:hypothetical protein